MTFLRLVELEGKILAKYVILGFRRLRCVIEKYTQKKEPKMEWYQVMTIVGANLGLFLWAVRQSRNDYLNCQKSIEAFKDAMLKETKDFHGRLCSLEEKMRNRTPKTDP